MICGRCNKEIWAAEGQPIVCPCYKSTPAECIEWLARVHASGATIMPRSNLLANIRLQLQAALEMSKALNQCTPETYDEHSVHEALKVWREAGGK